MVGANAPATIHDLLQDARETAAYGYPALSAYTTAVAVARAAGGDLAEIFRRERAWQSAWISRQAMAA